MFSIRVIFLCGVLMAGTGLFLFREKGFHQFLMDRKGFFPVKMIVLGFSMILSIDLQEKVSFCSVKHNDCKEGKGAKEVLEKVTERMPFNGNLIMWHALLAFRHAILLDENRCCNLYLHE